MVAIAPRVVAPGGLGARGASSDFLALAGGSLTYATDLPGCSRYRCEFLASPPPALTRAAPLVTTTAGALATTRGAVAALISSSGLLAPTRGPPALRLMLLRPALALGKRAQAIEARMR